MGKKTGLEKEVLRLRWERRLIGTTEHWGLASKIAVYGLLILFSFVYLYPLLHMLAQSLMSTADLMDTSANWIPTDVSGENYEKAIIVMDYWMSLLRNIYLAVVPTLCQTFICSIVGYGFARYNFPLKKFFMGLLLLSYLLPVQAVSMPNFLLLQNLNLTDGTIKPFLVTSLLGQGVNSALCILIFYNFHKQTPRVLLDAAQIDGAGYFRSYFRIAVPMSTAAILVVVLFTFVWYWNDTNLVNLYLGGYHKDGLTTLMIRLSGFEVKYAAMEFPSITESGLLSRQKTTMNDAIVMAGTMLSILPLLIFYGVLQRYFVESVDHIGITGE